MNKKGRRGYKMKGFCPFTAKSSSPMKQNDDDYLGDSARERRKARKEAYEARRAERSRRFRQTQGYKNMMSGRDDDDDDERRLSHPQKPIGSVDPAAPVAPRPFPTTYDPLSIQEQKLIAQSISKMGGFGTVHPMLVKGYGDLSSPAGRKRMQKLNAYHFYMTTRADTPEQAAKNRENLHQTLSRMEDKRRTSNFLGARNRSYDKYGRPIAELQEKYRKQVRDSIGVDPKTGRLIVSKVPLTEKQRMERDYPELTEQVRRRRRRRRRNGGRI